LSYGCNADRQDSRCLAVPQGDHTTGKLRSCGVMVQIGNGSGNGQVDVVSGGRAEKRDRHQSIVIMVNSTKLPSRDPNGYASCIMVSRSACR